MQYLKVKEKINKKNDFYFKIKKKYLKLKRI